MLGQEVRVYQNGIVWVDPDTRQRFLIGETRLEAEAQLRKWKAERFGAFAPIRVRALPLLPTGEKIPRAYWKALYSARSRAKRAGLPVMSNDEYVSLVQRAGGKCEVTGIEFSAEKPPGHKKAMWAPSIDQIKCGKGYALENCRLVCIAVNLAMNEFGLDVLTKIALAIGLRPLPSSAQPAPATAPSPERTTHDKQR